MAVFHLASSSKFIFSYQLDFLFKYFFSCSFEMEFAEKLTFYSFFGSFHGQQKSVSEKIISSGHFQV